MRLPDLPGKRHPFRPFPKNQGSQDYAPLFETKKR